MATKKPTKRRAPRLRIPSKATYATDIRFSAWRAYGGCEGFGCKGDNCTGYKHRDDVLHSPWSDKPLTHLELYHGHLIQPWSFKVHSVGLTIYLRNANDYLKIAQILLEHLVIRKKSNKNFGDEQLNPYRLQHCYHGFNDNFKFAEGLTFSTNPIPTGGSTLSFASDSVSITTPFQDSTGGSSEQFLVDGEKTGETLRDSRRASQDDTGGRTECFNGKSSETGDRTGSNDDDIPYRAGTPHGFTCRDNYAQEDSISEGERSEGEKKQCCYCCVEITEKVCHGLTLADWGDLVKDLSKVTQKIRASRFSYIWLGAGVQADTFHNKWGGIQGRCKTKANMYEVDDDDNPTRIAIGNPSADRYFLVEDLPRRGANYTFQLRNERANTCWNKFECSFNNRNTNSFDEAMKKELISFVDFIETHSLLSFTNTPFKGPLPGWDEFTGRYPVYKVKESDALEIAVYLDYYNYPISFRLTENLDGAPLSITYTVENPLPLDKNSFVLPDEERSMLYDFLMKHRYPYPFFIKYEGICVPFNQPVSVRISPDRVKLVEYSDLDLLHALAYTMQDLFGAKHDSKTQIGLSPAEKVEWFPSEYHLNLDSTPSKSTDPLIDFHEVTVRKDEDENVLDLRDIIEHE